MAMFHSYAILICGSLDEMLSVALGDSTSGWSCGELSGGEGGENNKTVGHDMYIYIYINIYNI